MEFLPKTKPNQTKLQAKIPKGQKQNEKKTSFMVPEIRCMGPKKEVPEFAKRQLEHGVRGWGLWRCLSGD